MQTADEIRKLLPVEKEQELLEDISEGIERAAIYGKHSVICRLGKKELLEKDVINYFKKLGFDVSITSWKTTWYQDIVIRW